MINNDTIRLLHECDAGVKMGVSAIDEVLPYVKADALKSMLGQNKTKHEELDRDLRALLDSYGDEGKAPSPIAKGMSWLETKVKLTVDSSDANVAEIITDGCNMGVKSLNRYLNQYGAADERSKEITKRLIDLEEKLAIDIRRFL